MQNNSHNTKDQATFEAAVARHFTMMVKALIKVLGLQWDDACHWIEAAIANTWQTFARKTRRAPVANWRAYLIESAKRMARRSLTRRSTPLSLDRLIEEQGFDVEAPIPVDWEARQRVIDCVRAAVASLPPRERLVVELLHFMERSHAEIAGQLGITVASSQVTLSRAMKRLRTMLSSLKREAA